MFDGTQPCAGRSDLWFSKDPARREEAARLCATCPFQDPCRELGNGQIATMDGAIDVEFGVWGGEIKLNPNASYYRSFRSRGELTAKQKETQERAEQVRVLLLEPGITKAEIGRRMGIRHTSVTNIIQNHLTPREAT